MGEDFLEVKELNISYPTRKETIVASNNVEFYLERGQILGILGEYQEKTKSLKASKIINNWSNFKEIFKIVIPPSEKEMLGL